jgi:hypothetical protein
MKKKAHVEGYQILAFDLDFFSSFEIWQPCNQLEKLKIKIIDENLSVSQILPRHGHIYLMVKSSSLFWASP